ncbi:translocation/assembly module TamB domain-containing protein [Algiphilus sp.]|uniref:translocation/assembly module TamB domain-containing protein n=1 Tax=Algiphilus sp. TaxID=1872431 RepID=UPI003B51E7EA
MKQLMTRLLSWLHRLLRLSTQVLTVTLVVVLILVGWLGLTTTGLRTVLDLADTLAGEQFSVEAADGRLLGSMTLRGLQIVTPAADVQVDTLRFAWVPGWIPGGTLYIKQIGVETVRVALQQGEEEPTESETEPSGPLDVLIPFRVVLAELSVRDVQIAQQGEALPGLNELTLSAWAAGRRIQIESLSVDQPEYGRYQMQAGILLPKGAVEVEDLQLTGAGTLRLDGRIPVGSDDALRATIDWQDLHWPAGAAQDARLLTSPEGNLQIGGSLAQPTAEGRIALYPSGSIGIDADWQGTDGFQAALEWRGLHDPLNPSQPAWQSAQGNLRAQGQPDAWTVRLDADATVALAPPEPERPSGSVETDTTRSGLRTQAELLPLSLQLEAEGGLTEARIRSLAIRLLEGRVRGSGQVQWQPTLSGDAKLRWQGINPAPLAPDFPGTLNGDATTTFAMRGDVPDARFQVTLEDSRLRKHALQLALEGQAQGTQVRLKTLRARSGSSRLEGSGTVTPPFDFQATLQSANLNELAPGIRGEAGLGLTLKGPMDALQLRLKGELHEVQMAGTRLAEARIDADVALNGPMRADLSASGVYDRRGDTVLLSEAAISLDGRIDDHTLTIDAQTPQLDAAARLQGGLDQAAMRWSGRLEALRLDPSALGLTAWTLRDATPLQASAEQARVDQLCLDGAESGALCLDAAWQAGNLNAALALEDFRLATLHPFLPPGMELDGGMQGDAEVTMVDGVLTQADSRFVLSEGALRAPDQAPLAFGPGSLESSVNDAGELLARLGLPVAAGAINGEVRLDPKPQGALDGQLNLTLPSLDFLPLFTPEVTEASGSLNARVRLSGTATAPDAQLEARLDNGTLALFTPGLTLEDISATVRTRDDQQLDLAFRAHSGGGSIEGNGTAQLRANPLRAELRVQGQDFQAANLPEAQAWISPDLTVRLEETLRISGRVDIPRATIEPEKFSSSGGVTPSADQVFIEDDDQVIAKGLPVNAEITVALGDEVSLTGYGLDTRLEGSITVIESPGKVTRGRGALTLEDGQYEAYGQKLAIRRGRIVFAGGPVTSPGLDFEAVRTPDPNVLVGIRVRGSVEQPQFQLFSEPPMEQNAQLSWLVLARPPTEIGEGSEESSALAGAALALGLSGGDWLAQRIGSRVGVDEISIGSGDGEDSSQARFTVGKYIGSRLYVSYGVSLFQPGQIFKLRYDLGRGFALQTETGVESGGDLLYTLERD